MLIDLSLPLNAEDLFLKKFEVRRFGHIGTHLDLSQGIELELSRFISPGKVLNVCEYTAGPVGVDVLQAACADAELEPGDFVIVRTGWLTRTYRQSRYFEECPELTDEAVDFLASRYPNMVGVDGPGLARRERHSAVDSRLAKHNIPVVENIAGTERLPIAGFTVYCFPLRFANLSGLPVRLVADCGA